MQRERKFGTAQTAFLIGCYFLSFAAAGNAFGSDLPTVSKDLPYRAARIYLIANGNRPAPVAGRVEDACLGADGICRTYPEAILCRGTDHTFCSFQWRAKSGRLFLVQTDGEKVPYLLVYNLCFLNLCN